MVKNTCRLCLSTSPEKSYIKIVPHKENLLKLVAFELNLGISKNPLICVECLQQVQEHADFKVNCIRSEIHIKDKAKAPGINTKVILIGEPLEKRIKTEQSDDDDDEEKVFPDEESVDECRTCNEPVNEDTYLFLKTEGLPRDGALFEMAKLCLAELDLDLTPNPVICEECADALQKMYEFKIMLLENEDKISLFLDEVNEKGPIDLNRMAEFSPKKIGATPTKKSNKFKGYRCMQCEFLTYQEYELFQHFLTHKKKDVEQTKSKKTVIKHVIKHMKKEF